MAAAKSLTPAELERVLQYMSLRSFAQRNRAMLMMTVAAGLRVGEVAGLTLGDVLDDDGSVRGGGCTEFCVNGLMAGNRRISRSGYDLKHKESSTQRSHR